MVEFNRSSFCNLGGCVEVATAQDGSVLVRSSKNQDGARSLEFTREEWIAFIRGVKAGEFDPA